MSRRMKSKHPRHGHPFGTLVVPVMPMVFSAFNTTSKWDGTFIGTPILIVGYESVGYSQAALHSNEHRVIILHEGGLYRSNVAFDSLSMSRAFNTLGVFDTVMLDVR